MVARNKKGQFVKGAGFWTGKKRPGLETSTTFRKGHVSWNKGTRKPKTCSYCSKEFLTTQFRKNQQFCSLKCGTDFRSGVNHPLWNGGKPKCKKCGKIIRWNREYCGGCYKKENHHWWKGGITKEGILIRTSTPYKKWRTNILERDNYTCQICFKRGGNLQVDHIKPFALFPELRLTLSNGRTLHKDCHKKTDSYLNNRIKREAYL